MPRTRARWRDYWGVGWRFVLTVQEPIPLWEPYDPATIVTAGISKLGSKLLELDEIASEAINEQLAEGVELARSAGFHVQRRTARGKTWRAICELAGST